jgi:hypothetical protein
MPKNISGVPLNLGLNLNSFEIEVSNPITYAINVLYINITISLFTFLFFLLMANPSGQAIRCIFYEGCRCYPFCFIAKHFCPAQELGRGKLSKMVSSLRLLTTLITCAGSSCNCQATIFDQTKYAEFE